MERKDFIKKFTVGGSVLLITPAFLASCSDGNDELVNNPDGNNNGIVIDLNSSSSSELNSVGGYIYSGNIIVIRATESQYIALSKICTHEGCTVKYGANNNEIFCDCHGSTFTTSGVVTNGPAPTNLKKYNVKMDGNSLIIT